jgi:hypothetical protein
MPQQLSKPPFTKRPSNSEPLNVSDVVFTLDPLEDTQNPDLFRKMQGIESTNDFCNEECKDFVILEPMPDVKAEISYKDEMTFEITTIKERKKITVSNSYNTEAVINGKYIYDLKTKDIYELKEEHQNTACVLGRKQNSMDDLIVVRGGEFYRAQGDKKLFPLSQKIIMPQSCPNENKNSSLSYNNEPSNSSVSRMVKQFFKESLLCMVKNPQNKYTTTKGMWGFLENTQKATTSRKPNEQSTALTTRYSLPPTQPFSESNHPYYANLDEVSAYPNRTGINDFEMFLCIISGICGTCIACMCISTFARCINNRITNYIWNIRQQSQTTITSLPRRSSTNQSEPTLFGVVSDHNPAPESERDPTARSSYEPAPEPAPESERYPTARSSHESTAQPAVPGTVPSNPVESQSHLILYPQR